MDDKSSGHPVMMCPPAEGAVSATFPGARQHEVPPSFPRSYGIDERLAPPETRVEYLDGRRIFSPPSLEPHASDHSRVDRVVGANVKRPFEVAVDMLTRTGAATDVAADVSVYEPTFDPATGAKTGRKLEELAFEVVDKQAASVPTRKAAVLSARGVRRIFCLFVQERTVCEWSKIAEQWEPLAPDAMIEDPCFVRPVRASALVDLLLSEDEIGRAMLVKKPPSIVAALAQSHAEGRAEAKQAAILRVFEKRDLVVPRHLLARINETSDLDVLAKWFDEALTAKLATDILK